MERRLAAVLAADVVGYGRLMGEDEAGTLERLKALRKDLVQPSVARRAGLMIGRPFDTGRANADVAVRASIRLAATS